MTKIPSRMEAEREDIRFLQERDFTEDLILMDTEFLFFFSSQVGF